MKIDSSSLECGLLLCTYIVKIIVLRAPASGVIALPGPQGRLHDLAQAKKAKKTPILLTECSANQEKVEEEEGGGVCCTHATAGVLRGDAGESALDQQSLHTRGRPITPTRCADCAVLSRVPLVLSAAAWALRAAKRQTDTFADTRERERGEGRDTQRRGDPRKPPTRARLLPGSVDTSESASVLQPTVRKRRRK